MTSEPRPACETRFLGPTDHKGARVKATHLNTKASIVIPWDHAKGPDENHEAAAVALFLRERSYPEPSSKLYRCSIDGGGWVWMLV